MKSKIYKRLKPYYVPMIGIIFFILSLILSSLVFGKAGGKLYVRAICFTAGFLLTGYFTKTKNAHSLLLGLLFIVFGIFPFEELPSMIPIFIVPQLFGNIPEDKPVFSRFGNWDIYYPYGRSLLEMAAANVGSVKDGYTDRPYPLEKIDIKKEDLIGFAGFMQKNMVATAYIEDNRVVLVFSRGLFHYIPFVKPILENTTYASISFSGEMSVSIAEKEYKKYNDPITFDRLCDSFGDVLMGLYGIWLKGEGSRIGCIIKENTTPYILYSAETFLDLGSFTRRKRFGGSLSREIPQGVDEPGKDS